MKIQYQSIISCLLGILKILYYEDYSASQALSNRLYHYIEEFDFFEKPCALDSTNFCTVDNH